MAFWAQPQYWTLLEKFDHTAGASRPKKKVHENSDKLFEISNFFISGISKIAFESHLWHEFLHSGYRNVLDCAALACVGNRR